MHRTLKPLVALTAGLALVALTAAPSAATLGTATAGTATLNITPTWSLDLAPGGTAPCSSAASTTLDVTMTTATSGTATLAMMPSLVLPPTLGRGFLRIGGTGTVTISGSSITIGPISWSGNVYPETASGSCVPNFTTGRCGNVAGTLTLSGTWTGTVTPPALSGTAVLSGTASMAAAGCTFPFSALNGKNLSMTNLTVPF